MNLKSLIRTELWVEISNSYIAENYKIAVLDAMRHLSKVVREKSGLDGDGAQLIGQAFGGDEPKLRLNKLQTQSEKDEQKGFLQIITGLYSGIRNPRTHEDYQDNKNTADPIIYFINYVLTVIDIARPPYSIEGFVQRVLDEDYVQSLAYTKELIKEIPQNKYFETLIEIYRHKAHGKDNILEMIFQELTPLLKDSELQEFLGVVSEELDTINNDSVIVTILRILPKGTWSRLKLTARMRTENKLIKSIAQGKMPVNSDVIRSGSLGTWITKIMDELSMTEELRSALVSNFISDNDTKVKYSMHFFMKYFPKIFATKETYYYYYAATAIKKLITEGDYEANTKISEFAFECPDQFLATIKSVFNDWTNPEKPDFYLRDGSPMLGNIPEHIRNRFIDDDIPF